MSQNWKTYKLGKVSTLQRGFDLPNPKRIHGDYPVIAASGFSSWHNEFKVKGPGVTTGRSGTLGQVFYEEGDYWPLNTALWVKDFHGNNAKFIYYFLQTLNFELFNSGTSVPTLNRNDVHSLDVQIPSLPEQKAIAQILSDIDDKIENNLAINKTLEEMAMELYKHWFVDFGPFKDGEFVESELGEIPKEWMVKRLDHILDIKYGKAHKKLADGKYPVYGSGGIMRYVDQYLYNEESILIPRKGTLSNLFYLTEPFWSVDTMFYSIIKEKYFGKYTFHFLKVTDLAGMDVGSAIPSLTTELLNRIKILVPDIDQIKIFDETVNRYFSSIKANIEENQTLTQLRNTLLPKLISGEVRLKEFEPVNA
ncbi:restriction endonuclease subunit S [Aequorivita capsosiphonis]|uniref:restriction endonuclease subunit S n=1 Tax=Aequorivita capsosiphonis TaxID=487317 RepID=UPI0004189E96|nr:restriction endonuclease subunit S [Aequorivita capsosiphonis]